MRLTEAKARLEHFINRPFGSIFTGANYERIWRDDYYSICQQLKRHVETSPDGFIHTSNGRHIQVRSKDSQPYHPIYSTVYGRFVSNKNHAFYFQKQFVYDIKSMSAR